MRLLRMCIIFCLLAGGAVAQDRFWVQIAAHQTLTETQSEARVYARRLDNVQGYYLGDGFYGIALGPYDENTARATLRRLLSAGQIPDDSFINAGRQFQQLVYPTTGPPPDVAQPRAVIAPLELINPPVETLPEAKASEARLSRAERDALQIALRWAGFYDGPIDGAFGRGTRRAMEDWQTAYSRNPTGILTTRQRAELLEQYNAVLTSVGMRMLRDETAGIALQMPMDVVVFDRYTPPFALYTASADIAQAQVVLISQPGDQAMLNGLYEVLQTLDIIPPDGPRRLRNTGFTIQGQDNDRISFTTVSLQDGQIKGFTLLWPTGDEKRHARVLASMRESFTRLPAVLDPQMVPPGPEQAIDMVSGLAMRKPRLSRSGFYASTDGLVVTTSQAVQGCNRITLDRTHPATVAQDAPDLGVAILRPADPLIPIAVAGLQTAIPRLGDRVAVAGYPFDGTLQAPTLTFGHIADIRGLSGDTTLKRLVLTARPGDAGGAILDESGSVLGMLLARPEDDDQILPQDVRFARNATDILPLLAAAGATPQIATDGVDPLGPVALAEKAADITVLVSCW